MPASLLPNGIIVGAGRADGVVPVLAVGDKALPDRALDGGGRDVIPAATDQEQGARERLRERERVSGAVRGVRLVAD